jgi:hypothetical protein
MPVRGVVFTDRRHGVERVRKCCDCARAAQADVIPSVRLA